MAELQGPRSSREALAGAVVELERRFGNGDEAPAPDASRALDQLGDAFLDLRERLVPLGLCEVTFCDPLVEQLLRVGHDRVHEAVDALAARLRDVRERLAVGETATELVDAEDLTALDDLAFRGKPRDDRERRARRKLRIG